MGSSQPSWCDRGQKDIYKDKSLSAVQGDPINTGGLDMPDTVRTAGVVLKYARDIEAGEAIFRVR